MPYKAIDVAKWFINRFDREAGDVITQLKLQKLLYYAEAWSQTLLERELFEEEIEAWSHGPVVTEVFEEFKDYGWHPLDPVEMERAFDPETEDVLQQVTEVYGELTAKTLERMTHNDLPWIEARRGFEPEERCQVIMPKPAIKAHFVAKYGAELNGQED